MYIIGTVDDHSLVYWLLCVQDAPSTPPVFSTEQEGEPEKKKAGGIKFTLGEEDEDEEDFEEVGNHNLQ